MPTAEVRANDTPVADGASLAHTARLNRRTPMTTWRLSRHRLLIEPECGEAQHVELAAVTMMCIRKAPSAWDMKRHRCDLTTSDGDRVTIVSTSWQRRGRYEDRAATYSPLIRALALAVQQATDGRCRVRGASQRWVYSMVLALAGFTLGLLIHLLVAGEGTQAWTSGSLWGLSAPICMIGSILLYTRLALPHDVDPESIPPTFLPPDNAGLPGLIDTSREGHS